MSSAQHPPHHPGICDQLPPPGAGIGSHSAPDHYREAATGNEKSERMNSSSDGYGAVRGSDRGQPLAQLQLPQKRLKSSIVGAWQSVQKALRNEIHEVEGKVIPKAEEHDGFADTISTSASEAAPRCTRGGSRRRDFPRRTLT